VSDVTVFGELVREAFSFLERDGFRFLGETAHLPAYAHCTYERKPIRVRVHWDGLDRASWTVLGRRHPTLRFLPPREVGLGHLDPEGESEVDLPHFDGDPEPLREALRRQAGLLESRGAALLSGDRQAWATLERRQQENMRKWTGEG
jgi:hypothetical protein